MVSINGLCTLVGLNVYDKCSDINCKAREEGCTIGDKKNGTIHMDCDTLYDTLEKIVDVIPIEELKDVTDTSKNSLKICQQLLSQKLNDIWLEVEGNLTHAKNNSKVIKMAVLLLLRKKGEYTSLFLAIHKYLKEKPEYANDFYDAVIISANNGSVIIDKGKPGDKLELRWKDLCLKRMLTALVKLCFTNVSHLKSFIENPQILKRNIEGYFLGIDKLNKFIFHDIVRNYVNDTIDGSKDKQFEGMGLRVQYDFTNLLDSICAECTKQNKERYLKRLYNLDSSKINDDLHQKYLKTIKKIYYVNLDDDTSNLSPEEIANLEYAAKNPLVPINVSEKQKDILRDIIVNDNKKRIKNFNIHFDDVTAYEKKYNPTSFLGMTYYLDKDYSKSTENILETSCYYGQNKYKESLVDIIYLWLESLKNAPMNQPSWKFIYGSDNESVDIRNFKANLDFSEDLRKFLNRTFSLEYSTNGYDLKVQRMFYKALSFHEIVRYVIYTKYESKDRDYILSQYHYLKKETSTDVFLTDSPVFIDNYFAKKYKDSSSILPESSNK